MPPEAPDQFKVGRDIRLDGQLRNGVFLGQAGHDDHQVPFEVRAQEELAHG